MVFNSHKTISTQELLSEVWKVLKNRKINYFEDNFSISEEEITITYLDGRQKKVKQDLTIFLSYDVEEKILSLEEIS